MDFLATMPLLNLILLLATIVTIVVVLAITLKGKKVKIGNTEISNESVVASTRLSEREILKRQIHISRAVCGNFKSSVPHYKDYNEKEIENICYKVSDVMEDLILFNHLSTDQDYVDSRFQLVWAVIEASVHTNFKEEDMTMLKDKVYKDFAHLVSVLLCVRQEGE